MPGIRRREFVACSARATAALAAAQRPRVRWWTFPYAVNEPFSFQTDPFRQQMAESGFIEAVMSRFQYLGAMSIRTIASASSRSRPATRRGDCHRRWRRFSPCGKVRDLDDTNCLHHRWRSGQAWLGREHQSARQQYDWHKPLYLCPRGKAAGATARGNPLPR